MIKYLENNKIDKSKWDTCINRSADASIFVYSWYLDVVCDNWSALILNDYEAVFPIAIKSKYKLHYAYQPFYSRYFGVYKEGVISKELVKLFLDAVPEKIKYFEFCLHESNTIQNKKLEITERKFQMLNINNTYEAIQKGYSENTRRSIKKSIKAELKIRPDIEPEKIVDLFKSTKGVDLEIFTNKDYKNLIKLMNTCLDKKKGQSIAIYYGKELCAAAFFMFSNNKFTYLKSGITEQGKAKGAMYLLIDYFIREHCGNKYTFDFGGSSIESVANFYKKFGAKDFVYLQIKKNNLPAVVKWIKK